VFCGERLGFLVILWVFFKWGLVYILGERAPCLFFL
jgi:hypothetical protein